MMREIAGLVDPACFDMDPIAVSEKMAEPDSHDRLRAADLRLCQLCDGQVSGPTAWPLPTSPSRANPAGRLGARRHRHRRLGFLARRRMRRSTSPTGSPAAMSSAAPMPRPAASRAMPRPGRTTRSMLRPATSTAPRARRWKAPGCGRATTATWRSSRRRRTASTRGCWQTHDPRDTVVADLNRCSARSFRKSGLKPRY